MSEWYNEYTEGDEVREASTGRFGTVTEVLYDECSYMVEFDNGDKYILTEEELN